MSDETADLIQEANQALDSPYNGLQTKSKVQAKLNVA